MNNILIDFDNIIKHNNLSSLQEYIEPVPKTKSSLGLVLVIPNKQLNILESLPKGRQRIDYIDSSAFIESIFGLAFLIYDKNKRVCEITKVSGPVISYVIDSALCNLPNDVTLWIRISLNDYRIDSLLKEYIKLGFHDPYINKTSPLGHTFNSDGLCMIRQNDINDDINSTNEVKFVMTQFLAKNKSYCTLKARLSNSAIQYLRNICKRGFTWNKDGKISQKELAGKLVLSKITSDLVSELDVDKESIVSGGEEEVDLVDGLYNFHSHPQEAYERNNVQLGWPSAHDYLGFIKSSVLYDTILHIVSCVEGFYVISLNDYWTNNKDKIDKDVISFVLEQYNHEYKKGDTLERYVRTVNSTSYNGNPLFLLQFFTWDSASDEFIVNYSKKDSNCFARHSTWEKFNELYSH